MFESLKKLWTPDQDEVNGDEPVFVEDPYDLKNLEIIDPEKVKEFVEMLNNISDSEIGNRSLILALGTGGTIACEKKIGDDGKILKIPTLDFEKMFAATEPSLQQRFLVKGLDIFQLDSSQMQFVNVHDLAIIISHITKNMRKNYKGILVIHGTDTMAEASGHMATMLGEKLAKPIIYTGAQVAIGEDRSDGGSNLREALFTIQTMADNNQADIVIVFGDATLYAYGAQKVSENSRNAFDTPMHELAGELSVPGEIIVLQDWTRKNALESSRPRIYSGNSHLLELSSKMSVNPDFVAHQIMHGSVKGVAQFTYGAGTVDQRVIRAAAKAMKKKGIPGFASNPASYGTPKEKESEYPPEAELRALGFETIHITPEYARGKFELAIRRFPNNPAEIVDFMRRQFIGEIPTHLTKRRSPLLRH